MQHDRARALFRVQLPLIADRDADPLGVQQPQQRRLVLQLGAGGIAERIAPAAIALAEHLIEVAVVLAGEA